MPISFDLYGTLVTAERPTEPWLAVADELTVRSIDVPDDWENAYRSSHIETEPLAEVSLVNHTLAALESRGVYANPDIVSDALLAAFDTPVSCVENAVEAVETAASLGRIGILSNCSLPGLVEAALNRIDLPVEFDSVVTSVGCGWRKPHNRAFTAAATALGCETNQLIHVGDDPRTDGGGRTIGVTVILTSDSGLADVSSRLEAMQ